LRGSNPYLFSDFLAARPPDFPSALDFQGHVTPYPPAAFPLSAPFALLDWKLSTALFACSSALLWAIALRALATEFQLESIRQRWFFGLALSTYGLHTGLALGQYSTPAIALTLLAWCVSRKSSNARLAAALGYLALALKPQIGIVFFIVAALERRWRLCAWMIAGYVAVTAIAVVPMLLNGHANFWGALEAVRAVYDVQSETFCCVNLRMITRNLPQGASAVIEIGVLLGLAAVVLRGAFERWLRGPALFVAVYVVILLSMYHRPYDLPGLILIFAWILPIARPTWSQLAVAVSALIVVQPVPTLAALGSVPPDVLAAAPNAASLFLIPHTTWLLLTLFFFAALASRSSRPDFAVH
jgi:hypothetical protein